MIEIDKTQLTRLLHLGYIESDITVERLKVLQTHFENKIDISDEEAKHQLKELIKGVIRKKNNIGAGSNIVYSSGVDSTVILLMAMEVLGNNVKAVICENNKQVKRNITEADLAREICNKLGIRADVYKLYGEAEVFDNLDKVEDLFISSSIIPTTFIYKRAGNNILTGDGGDELFCGYDRYLFGYYVEKYKVLKRLIKLLPNKTQRMRKAKQYLDEGYVALASIWSEEEAEQLTKLMDIKSKDRIKYYLWAYHKMDESFSERLHKFDARMLFDIATELYGVETRKVETARRIAGVKNLCSPFLDPEVQNFCTSLPIDMKYRNGTRKWLLREIIKDYIPDYNCLVGSKKRGFSNIGFEQTEMENMKLSCIKEYVSIDLVERTYMDHLGGKRDNSEKLFSLLFLDNMLKNGYLKIK